MQTDKCSLCDNKLEMVLELSPTPPANNLEPYQKRFPLNLTKCHSCDHLQIDFEVSKEIMFNHYTYVSNTSEYNRNHFKKYAEQMTNQFHPKNVLDIGSNDGLFLTYFKDIDVVGVDPSDVPTLVSTIKDYFNEDFSYKDKFDLITCNNCFAHNKDLSTILKGVKKNLAENGTFVFEVSYAMNLLKDNLFDLVYHEHYHHWHLRPMIGYFRKFGLAVYDAELIGTHGGSIRVYAQHLDEFGGETDKLRDLLNYEQNNFNNYLHKFKKEVPNIKRELMNCISNLTYQKNTISILGYPAKACTSLYYFGLQFHITNVYDNNPLKIGKRNHFGKVIKSEDQIAIDKPDYLLLLRCLI